jgi:hypothetical protein
LNGTFPSDQKYSYETRNQSNIRTYSKEYSEAYSQSMKGMVEKQIKLSVKHLADTWLTCWINAGRPD